MPIIGQISVGDGATFTPAVDNDGVISWDNNKNLPNPASVDIPQAVMDRYQIAPIASPAFTGNPTAPTQAKTDNSTNLATTAYVQAVVADYLELTGGSITGDVDITGDLSVSGTITGNLTGNVTGNVTGTASGNLALSGGTMMGAISFDATGEIGYRATTHTEPANPCKQLIVSSTDINHWSDEGGAKMSLHTYDSTGTNTNEDGGFSLVATNGTNSRTLSGKPDGELAWNGKNLDYAPDYSVFNSYETFTAPTVFSNRIKVVPSGKFGGYKQVGKLVYVHYTFQMNVNMNKGAWTIAQNFPPPFIDGGAWSTVPLVVSAWYGDAESGYFTSASIDGYGTLYLVLSGNVTAGTSGDTNHGIVVHGVYMAK